ncbi:MAG: peptidylprolyl isomerase [Pirellulaceae bacterium]|nr:peptidylprolyl isomerase [Pirellulaceae bacterium]
MPHRLLTFIGLFLLALFLRAALGQEQPPPGPFSGREDPYFPKASQPQRYPIVNQPTPLPKLGTLTEEIAETPQPEFRQPVLRQPVVPSADPRQPDAADGGQRIDQASAQTDDPLNELGDRFRPGEIMARIGDQIVLYGDVASLVDQGMNAERASVTNKYQLAEFNARRDAAIKSLTRQLAEKKLQYVEFRRTIALKAGDKAVEAEKDINKNVKNAFDNGLVEMREKLDKATTKKQVEELMRGDIVLPRLALLMKENSLETQAQLDETLRTFGSSVDKQIAMFREHNLGQSAVIEKIKKQPEVTHAELLEYYRKNPDKFSVPAKARFELLSIYFSRSEGRTEAEKRTAAKNQIASMGNAVFLGRPFADVAKQFSHEANASTGGQYDWISKGSLASEVIDAAAFSLPLNRLSEILKDERGHHIVRVQERAEARQIPFEEAQKEIKETIKKERREAKIKEVLESLKEATTIWTVYDEEEENARNPAKSGAAR